jgi:SAM-dependent methyltransferase
MGNQMRPNDAILAFQRKRGDSSAAFVLPFLDETMDVLDVGCGPGPITAALAKAARSAIGIDSSASAIAAARELSFRARLRNLSFVRGTMTGLPFGAACFDAVFFHAVLYHLDAAMLAATLSEARRVLKPGGLIATRDADVGGNVLHPETPGLLLALDLWARWYEHRGPEAARFGRRQGAILRAHGFVPAWSGASFVNHSADAETRRDSVTDATKSLRGMSADLIARGLARPDEIEAALAAWEAWGGDPDSVYLRCRCECVARKPA